jgi:hypothetical protein
MITDTDLHKAVALACPGRPFVLNPETYAGLTMLDGGIKPTLAQLETAWANRPPNADPAISVTMAALRLALGRDICIQIGAFINAVQDVNQKFQMQTWWDKAPTVNSSHPVVEQFRAALNKTPEQVKEWFEAAFAIDNP